MSADELKFLELRHEHLCNERDRLRSARANFTGRLGPLPASAGIVVGLAGTIADRIDAWAIWAAGGLFLATIAVSISLSGLPPYRRLRADRVKRFGANGDAAEEVPDAASWLRAEIALEQEIYGRLGERTPWRTLRPQTLQQAFDIERRALNVVQALFAMVIVVLLVAILTH